MSAVALPSPATPFEDANALQPKLPDVVRVLKEADDKVKNPPPRPRKRPRPHPSPPPSLNPRPSNQRKLICA